jgi:glucuronosyltransferase|uniref:UDP-glucuronosyltransferase 2B9 n=1 Tax=Sipha flava TaxID=143950 RepID=A0A2S2Q5R3_9HEMI
MNRQILFFTVALTVICLRVLPVESAKILAIETAACKSHWKYMSGMLQALVNGGHNVTVFTPYPDGDRENYQEVDVSQGYKKVLAKNINDLKEFYGDPFKTLSILSALARERCDKVYDNWKLKEMLNNTYSDFDIVLTELFYSDCVSYVANKFDLPLIYITPLPLVSFMESSITGHISNPALVSDIMVNYRIPRTFVQRLSNTIVYIISTFVIKYTELKLKYSEPKEYDLIQPVTPSLVFVNGHFISEAPKPLAANVINVGGIHLKAPKRLQKVGT